jgi:hypothetical protein
VIRHGHEAQGLTIVGVHLEERRDHCQGSTSRLVRCFHTIRVWWTVLVDTLSLCTWPSGVREDPDGLAYPSDVSNAVWAALRNRIEGLFVP